MSLQETEEFECWVEPASGVWTVGRVDSTHLITGPCVCIVMLDNGPAAVACQQEMYKLLAFKGKQALCLLVRLRQLSDLQTSSQRTRRPCY